MFAEKSSVYIKRIKTFCICEKKELKFGKFNHNDVIVLVTVTKKKVMYKICLKLNRVYKTLITKYQTRLGFEI